jgi:dihydroorotase
VYDLIIRDATIVSSSGRQVADVAIAKGKIQYVGPRPPRPRAKEEISAIGKFLMPGVIDTAVQFDPNGDPGIWQRESAAAVTGGVTTVLSLPHGDHPVVDVASAKRRAKVASQGSWCNFAMWGASTGTNEEALRAAFDEKLIVGALASMGARAEPTSLNPDDVPRFLNGPGVVGLQFDCEGEGMEETAAAIAAAARDDRSIHLVHLSTALELGLIDPVKGDLPVTAGVTPHHLFLSTDDLSEPLTTWPPVRPEHDRRTLWTAVKRGRLDCVASDHHPNKEGGTGVPGSELLFPLMLSAVRYGRLSLELLVSLCSESPARIFGLPSKGRIARGCDADLVLFSEGEITRVDASTLLSGAGWSPYGDREAAPKPDLVLVNGRPVSRSGQLLPDVPGGEQAILA